MSTATKPASSIALLVETQLSTSPRRMRAALAATILFAVIMAIGTYMAYASIQRTMQTVGKDAAPSIVAAEHIQALLADANASGMNAVLEKDAPNGPSWTQYRSDINTAHDELITASQNITYGNAERVPIFTMESQLGAYEYTVGQAFGNDNTNLLTAGNTLFRQSIQPASAALDVTNYKHLSQTYVAHRREIGWQLIVVGVFLVLLLGVLVGVQFSLFRLTHRILNVGYVVATIVTIFLMVYAGIALNTSEGQLVAAKQNSFDSINALWSARATSYLMNADESLYLLHASNADALTRDEADYTDLAQKMTSIDAQTAVTAAKNGQAFEGYLGQELANITYPGERAAALDAVNAWANYTGIDKQIRQLLTQGNYQQALTLDLGYQVGQSNWAFGQYDAALGRVIAINQHYFDRQVNDAFAWLRPFPFVLAGALLVIIVACGAGMRPRLKEYAF